MGRLSLLLFVVLSVLAACKKSGPTAATATVVDTTVYAAGYWGGVNYTVAAFWVNGKLFSLTDTTGFASALAIDVAGSDVYVAGVVKLPMDAVSVTPTYWKNGQA